MATYSIDLWSPISGAALAWLAQDTNPQVYDATIDQMEWELNGIGKARISIPVTHPVVQRPTDGQLSLTPNLNEIRIWLRPKIGTVQIVWWGVITRVHQGFDTVEVQASTLEEYLRHRFIGDFQRQNYVPYGDGSLAMMNKGPAGWWIRPGGRTVGYWSNTIKPAGPTATALELSHFGRLVDLRTDGKPVDKPRDINDWHGEDNAAHLWIYPPGGNVVIIKAWFFIRDDWQPTTAPPGGRYFTFGGKPYENRGLYAQTQKKVGSAWTYVHSVSAEIHDGIERNRWHRQELSIFCSKGERIELRLYPVAGSANGHGGIVWSNIGAYLEESLSYYNNQGGYWAGTIIEGIVKHVQARTDTANWNQVAGPLPVGKSNLRIDRDPKNELGGVKQDIAYQHSDHHNAWDSILAITQLENGPDAWISWSADGRRRFISVRNVRREPGYVTVPGTGEKKSPYLIINGPSANVIDIDGYQDGANFANAITVTGTGDGPDREEAFAFNTKNRPNNRHVVWEAIESGGSDLLPRDLQSKANKEADIQSGKKEVMEARLAEDDFVGHPVLLFPPGTVFRVYGAYGKYQFPSGSMWRVVAVVHTPDDNITTVEMNPYP